jgi:hypothetical protein
MERRFSFELQMEITSVYIAGDPKPMKISMKVAFSV